MCRRSFSKTSFNKTRRRGTALLEAALCVAVLAPLAVMGLEYAYALYRMEEVRMAVERAARWSATAPIGESEAGFAERVRGVAAYGAAQVAAGPKTPRLAGIGPDKFSVELRKDGGRVVAVRVAASGIRLNWPGGGRVLRGEPAAEMPRAR